VVEQFGEKEAIQEVLYFSMRFTQILAFIHDKKKPNDKLLSHVRIDSNLKALRTKYQASRKARRRLKKELSKEQNYLRKGDIII